VPCNRVVEIGTEGFADLQRGAAEISPGRFGECLNSCTSVISVSWIRTARARVPQI
jgi:hypothetical protein